MYFYRTYNLAIISEQAFPELPQIERCKSPDVRISYGPLEESSPSNRGNTFRGAVEGIARFEVCSGTEILVEPNAQVEDGLLRPLVLGPLMSILLRQRGLLVLHASCVVLQGKGVAFMGNSGWGKSTLAELFYSQGERLVTDDVMAVQVTLDPPDVIPSYPQIKLMPDAAASLGHTPNSFPALNSYGPKLARRVGDDFCQAPVPLHRLYVLDVGTQHQITPLPLQDGFRELVKHSRAVGLLSAPNFRETHLKQCTSLLQKLPLRRLQRQMSLDLLPELVELVKQDLVSPCTNLPSSMSAHAVD